MSSKPLAGSRRKSKSRKKSTANLSGAPTPDFTFKPSNEVKANRQTRDGPHLPRTPRKGTILAMPFNQTFIQTRNLPLLPDRIGFARLVAKPVTRYDREAAAVKEAMAELQAVDLKRKSYRERNQRKKYSQFRRWTTDVIPSLIQPYLQRICETEHGRLPPLQSRIDAIVSRPCTCAQHPHNLHVVAAQWDHLEDLTIRYCACKPVAEQLLVRGLFGCAPIQPSMAFGMDLLELVSTTMLYIAPKVSGWSSSLEWFWKERGYVLGPKDYLKRRFNAAFQWFNVLRDQARAYVDAKILQNQNEEIHTIRPPPSMRRHFSPSGHILAPSTHLQHTAPSTPTLSRPRKRRRVGETLTPSVSATPPLFPVPTPSPPLQRSPMLSVGKPGPTEPLSTPVTTTHTHLRTLPPNVDAEPLASHSLPSNPISHTSASQPPPTPVSRPSAYLRRCCPACFGGSKPDLSTSSMHCLVAIDANFAQKCLKGRYEDPQVQHPHTQFITQEELDSMASYVEALRKTNPSVHSLRLAEDILKECQDSFLAADESQAKASIALYVDTGLVALVCRHDRLLWLANLTTAGERQHYVFALLKRLFSNLPEDWHVGLLYDIACQIERSMLKHGIMREYYHRMSFAVSVFHAYGHQWPCQLLYHPRKVMGFGLSDGEGCERFWSTLKRLIPSLRISGRHRRRWMLDRQVIHYKDDSLRKLGEFIARKRKACMKREDVALKIRDEHHVEDAVLRAEWAAQVETQTAPLKRQSKNAGDQVIQRILTLRTEHDETHARMTGLRGALATELDPEEEEIALEKLSTATEMYELLKWRITKAEKGLGIRAHQQLGSLKGNTFLRHKMNANALKTRIRAKLVARKFERVQLERAYHHQVMKDKDHQQTKTLLKRSHRSITALVCRYNRLVDDMKKLKRVPVSAHIPAKLEAAALFRLDVDDDIWLELGWEDGDEAAPPRWMADEDIRTAIPALLEIDRVKEERERLDAEEIALKAWLREEVSVLKDAVVRYQDDEVLVYQLNTRLRDLWEVSQHWKQSLDPNGYTADVWMSQNDLECRHQLSFCTNGSQSQRHGFRRVSSDIDSNESFSSVEGSDSAISETDEEELMELVEEVMGREVGVDRGRSLTLAEDDGGGDGDMKFGSCLESVEEAGRSGDGRVLADGVSSEAQGGDGLLLGLIRDGNVLTATRRMKHGSTCGRFSCGEAEICRLQTRDMWFDGTVISVVAEALFQAAGVKAQACHIGPHVLHAVRRILDHPGKIQIREIEVASILRQTSMGQCDHYPIWVIPAHVSSHWTLVAVHTSDRTLRFYDSMPERPSYSGDERQVREEVMLLMKILGDSDPWDWITEKRMQRQRNEYDCGAFVLGDMAAYIHSGCPSTWGQDAMPQWRRSIVELLTYLRNVRVVSGGNIAFTADELKIVE